MNNAYWSHPGAVFPEDFARQRADKMACSRRSPRAALASMKVVSTTKRGPIAPGQLRPREREGFGEE